MGPSAAVEVPWLRQRHPLPSSFRHAMILASVGQIVSEIRREEQRMDATRFLVVIADDYGIGPETSRAILELAARKVVTGTVLLVNSPHAEGAVRAWRQSGVAPGNGLASLPDLGPAGCAGSSRGKSDGA